MTRHLYRYEGVVDEAVSAGVESQVEALLLAEEGFSEYLGGGLL